MLPFNFIIIFQLIFSSIFYIETESNSNARNEPETKRPIEIDFFKKELKKKREMENSSESVNKPISTHFSKQDRRSRSKSVDKPGPSNFFNQENENNPELEDKSGFIDFFQQELKNDSKNKEISEAEPEEEEKKNIPFHIFL
ncbi:uncharacterized protein LOC126908471 isoform X2 [Daktulosphaira vitifoliae]|uniref:uncharacterized protein LOC126908471 isoform X2 n=1 Tax=Daktulosphaira vitifoliae TaxID=58002 RepID=UPI0021A9D2C2|nr:uncharacterized protein LOC126908471 isoform X2 [Daktulosphaira vitifoliae]